MLDKYLQMFATLRTDRGRNRHPEIMHHLAPHKPFLLLSVTDLIAQGLITETLMSIGTKYEVLVSKRVQTEQNLPGHILTLRDRPIFTPAEDQYWPAQENLDYHRTRRVLECGMGDILK